jgi:hypothetical protein
VLLVRRHGVVPPIELKARLVSASAGETPAPPTQPPATVGAGS